jgi:hypothetical protein
MAGSLDALVTVGSAETPFAVNTIIRPEIDAAAAAYIRQARL